MQTPAASEASVRRRHERRRLLVPNEDELDARRSQRLDDVQVLLAGNGEDAIDTLVLECLDEQIGSFHCRCP
jgi:hypothetical protein